RAIAAAAATVRRVPAGNAISIIDPPASASRAYPISTFTYVIVPKQTTKAASLRKFIFYGLTAGQAFGPKLGFAPIPRVVLSAGEKPLLQVKPSCHRRPCRLPASEGASAPTESSLPAVSQLEARRFRDAPSHVPAPHAGASRGPAAPPATGPRNHPR